MDDWSPQMKTKRKYQKPTLKAYGSLKQVIRGNTGLFTDALDTTKSTPG